MVSEPVVAYQSTSSSQHSFKGREYELSGRIDPNVPFHGTHEEWWEHFHRIEEGEFTPLEEANKEFEEDR